MNDDGDAALSGALARHPHLPQILDLLSESGCTTAFLLRIVPIGRTDTMCALRLIAAHGLLVADSSGSWDEPLAISGTLRLTDRGEAIVEELSKRHSGRTVDQAHPLAARHRFRRRG